MGILWNTFGIQDNRMESTGFPRNLKESKRILRRILVNPIEYNRILRNPMEHYVFLRINTNPTGNHLESYGIFKKHK